MEKHAKVARAVDVQAIGSEEVRAQREASRIAWKKSFMHDLVQSAWWFNALVGGIALLAIVSNWVVKHYGV